MEQGCAQATRQSDVIAGKASKRVGDYDCAMRPLMDERLTQKAVDYVRAHTNDTKPFFLLCRSHFRMRRRCRIRNSVTRTRPDVRAFCNEFERRGNSPMLFFLKRLANARLPKRALEASVHTMLDLANEHAR